MLMPPLVTEPPELRALVDAVHAAIADVLGPA
jgi:adenosylmethionine-8-amino-7-oxononanoate aminotransferase